MTYPERNERINRLVGLIKMKAIGTKNELAGKLNVSRSTVTNDFGVLEWYDAVIAWCSTRRSYYFVNDIDLDFDPRQGKSPDPPE